MTLWCQSPWGTPEWRTLLCSVYSWLLECNNMHRLHKWVPQENTDSALRHCSTSRGALSLLKKDDNGNVEMVVTHKKKAKRFSCVNQIHIVWQENNSVSSEDLGSLKFLWKKVQHSESGWYAHDLRYMFVVTSSSPPWRLINFFKRWQPEARFLFGILLIR